MTKKIVEYEIIKRATSEDIEAIEFIVDYYDKYINKLSTRYLIDDYGNSTCVIDLEIKGQLQNKLIAKILLFKT